VDGKVQTHYRCMWMARWRQRHRPQKCNSSWTQKKTLVYQKCLEENQDTLKADRVIEIATDVHNSDCEISNMQTLSTASAAATAIEQGSTQLHEKHWQDGKLEKGHGKNDTYTYTVYGASASDLNAVQCFLKRCHKRRYVSELIDIHNWSIYMNF